MTGPVAAFLPDGRRLHLQHGPIDLVLEAFGAPDEVAAAYRQALDCFRGVLAELVAELPTLRRPASPDLTLRGAVARRMLAAVLPHLPQFVTPMAAVAGAVADHVLAAMTAGRRLERAYVNDGGDIAIHLAPGSRFEIGVVTRVDRPALDAKVELTAEQPVRGIATSGRGGRSLSLGIADSVTVLASDAAAADAAATLIANAVDVAAPEVRRAPACELDPDSDLGERLVTVAVAPLPVSAVKEALDRGAAAAADMRGRGLIEAAFLALQGRQRVVGSPASTADMAGRSREDIIDRGTQARHHPRGYLPRGRTGGRKAPLPGGRLGGDPQPLRRPLCRGHHADDGRAEALGRRDGPAADRRFGR